MSVPSKDTFHRELRELILNITPLEPNELTLDTPLIGHLDSLNIVEILVFIEEYLGYDIQGKITRDDIGSMASLTQFIHQSSHFG
jgi:acyl carrier protein